MLVIPRKVGEAIVIGDSIKVSVVRISGGKVRIGIEVGPNAGASVSDVTCGDKGEQSAVETVTASNE